tara:strand:+ start:221 stop:445 length:225 start_codon:yes stop_codon:yes gene_type:complete
VYVSVTLSIKLQLLLKQLFFSQTTHITREDGAKEAGRRTSAEGNQSSERDCTLTPRSQLLQLDASFSISVSISI